MSKIAHGAPLLKWRDQGRLEAAEEIGFMKGEAGGAEKAAIDMLKRKRPLHEISADTGLPMARLEKLSETEE